MTGEPSRDPAPPRRGERPWWVPLLGVGSVGLGGLLALGGLAGCGIGMSGPPSAREAVLAASLAWLIPGALLGISGVGVVLGRRWGRVLSLVAAGTGLVAVGIVGWTRSALPPAVADTAEWAFEHPQAPPWTRTVREDLRRREGADPLELLRNPTFRDANALTFAVYCCVPTVPWYLVVLLACGPSWGGGVVRPGGGGDRTSAGGPS